MISISIVLDFLAIALAFGAATLWLRASSYKIRRVNRYEELDHLDFNRLVVIINRAQVLNAKAAFATAISVLAVAMRFAYDVLKESGAWS